MERSVLVISLLNYVNDFKLSYNTLNPYTCMCLQISTHKTEYTFKNLTPCLIRTAALLLLELDSQEERISSNVKAKNVVSEYTLTSLVIR